jgi:hypothetical protein
VATYVVNTISDSANPAGGLVSLRKAINDANANPGADTITFDAALDGQTITLGATLPQPTGDLTIVGRGADKTIVSGGGAVRIWLINDGTAARLNIGLSEMTLTAGAGSLGSVFVNTEHLTLDKVAVTNSTASSDGVITSTVALTVTNSSFSGNRSSVGTINSTGTLSVSNSTFYDNTATVGAAAIYSIGGATIESSTFVRNTAPLGGAFYADFAFTLRNSILAANTAPEGSAIYFSATAAPTMEYNLIQGTVFRGTPGPTNITGSAAGAYTPGDVRLVGGLGVFIPVNFSPVLNAGNPAYTAATPPTVDQLGNPRVFGDRIDIGAIELQERAIPFPVPATASPALPSAAPVVMANFTALARFPAVGPANPLPATVTTPAGQVLPNPLLEQQKAVAAIVAKVDAGQLSLPQAQEQIVDLADATTSVATLSYQFFTGKLPSRDGLDYLISSPQNPNDLNDGYYAGMSLENRYINFAVNLGKLGEGRANFEAGYGGLSLEAATAQAYAEIFGPAPAGKIAAILTSERTAYFNALGGDALGAKAAMVGFLLAEAAKSDLGPYAAKNENFLYDLLDGTAAFAASLDIYLNAGPSKIGLVGMAEA